jgi:diguanylate cyclase (GGDEF)-like protein/PAS domain S-box-containing protein
MNARLSWLLAPSVRPWWLAALLLGALVLWPPAAVQRLDLLAYDLGSRALRPPPAADSAIIAIDERSLQALGRWPWRRSVHADLLAQLQAAGVRSVAFGLLLTEASASPHDEDDRQLAAALARFSRVVLPVAPAPASPDGGMQALLPRPEFIHPQTVLGHVDVEVDADAVARRLFLVGGVDGQYWEALPLALWHLHAGPQATPAMPRLNRRLNHAAPQSLQAATWERGHEVLLPAVAGEMPVLSYVDVLQDPALAATLAGRAVWVGVTAAGLGDRLSAAAAPSGSQWSAVQWHAHAYEALRAGRLVTPAGPASAWWLGVLPLGLMALNSQRRGKAHSRWHERLTALLVPAPLLLAGLVLLSLSIWIPVTAATLATVAGYLLWRAELYRHTRKTLHRTRELGDAALRAITDAVVVVDTRGEVRYLNPVAAHLAGRSPDQARGQPMSQLYALGAEDRQRLNDALSDCITHRLPARLGPPVRVSTDDGERLLRICVSPVTDPQGRVESAVFALSDVTDVVSAAQRLHFEATHDALTGLPNRVLLADRLSHAMAAARRSGRSVAVLFMDLDRFKRINDSLGHRHGDTILKAVAHRLLHGCRANDTVARWGGDEFVIVLEDVDSRDAVAVVASKLIETVSQDVSLDGIEVQCSCSIGIAMAPQDSTDADALLAMADTAMYRGKSQAGHRFEFYAADMNAWSREWLAMETQLRQALGRGEFELHYQPQVRVNDSQPIGLEALLRWRTGSGELILPGRFINVAEESGLILPIGTWAIEAVALQLAQWINEGVPVLTVAINVSARQCLDRSLVKLVAGALEHTGIPAHLIKLEITETTAMADVEHVISLLEELRALGVSLAVDDFGTGYSSLAYLKRFPIDQIKIDQSFVRDITQDPNDAAIVRATIALAHGLGVPVIAEGVETEEQARFLAQHGCDMAQGYFYARPLDREDVTEFLKSKATHRTTPPGAAPAPDTPSLTPRLQPRH